MWWLHGHRQVYQFLSDDKSQSHPWRPVYFTSRPERWPSGHLNLVVRKDGLFDLYVTGMSAVTCLTSVFFFTAHGTFNPDGWTHLLKLVKCPSVTWYSLSVKMITYHSIESMSQNEQSLTFLIIVLPCRRSPVKFEFLFPRWAEKELIPFSIGHWTQILRS